MTELEAGESATATVGLEGAADGVSTYEMTLATNDTDVATLEDVTVLADGEDGPLVHTDRSADGSELTVVVALLDAAHEPGDAIDLFDAELETRGGGDVEIEVTEIGEITDLETDAYGIDRTEAADLSVTDPGQPVADVTIDAPNGVQPNATTTATVGLEGATNGVSTYEMALTTNDTDVATLEDVAVRADGEHGPLTHVEKSADGSALVVTVALLDATHEPDDSIELFDVELETHAEGVVELDVDEVGELTDLDLDAYEIGQSNPVELEVADDPGLLATIEEVPEDVVAGDEATVVAEIENAGYTEASRTVDLVSETGVVDSTTITLDSGATERVELTWETTRDDVGEHDLLVETGDDTAEVALEVAEPPTPAIFEPEITAVTEPVEGGELVLEADVENTGDRTDTQTVGLEIDGTTVDSAEGIELEGGNATNVTLIWNTEDGDHGEYDAAVTTENESAETSVVVREDVPEPFFDVTIDESNDPVTAGEDLVVNATVTNVGGEPGAAEIDFEVDGELVETGTVDLSADEETTLSFVSPTDADDPPDVDVTVSSPDATETTTTRVDEPEPATFEVVDVDVPTTVTQGETFDATVTVENVGDLEGSESVELHFDDRRGDADDREIGLDGGERTTVTLTFDVPVEPRAGEHEIDVTAATPDDSVSRDVVVDYESIESGLEALDGGGVVAVAAGEYAETVTIETADVSLEGIAGSGDTTVSPAEDVAFDVAAENVTIEGVTIDGTGAETGVVARSDGVTIERNVFSGLETGIHLTDSDGHAIAYNTFRESVETGIAVDASNGNAITQNVVEGVDGIVFDDGAGETTVNTNEITVTNDAIRFEEDAGPGTVLEENNLIAGNWSVNNLAEMTVEGSANYYGEDGLEENTNGDVVDDEPADQYDGAEYELAITAVASPLIP
ncbi:right-handed parallel beta-helix repeat-containing protein [Halobacteria archaeon AArc-m2/3/4]|uniref:Right-handed parallel beta-helix repeat-containing protein n=1 Tax=Natronoglomus mannanivorans TaxID=2979990 RepID=A0ABT2QJ38_9EURY|nr:right-handed parallel beta-helix repeat-containing protein [Halobacteria archaeon AArc-m2/3/4]